MNFVGTVLSGLASPLIEFYGETRKWKIAEETAKTVTQGVGSRIDRMLDATGSLTRHSYVRLENGVSEYLEESGQYLKLFGTACSMHFLSTVINFSGAMVGCNSISNRYCTLLECSALGSSAYACFATTVLGYKVAASFYRYFKTTPPAPTGPATANFLPANRQPLVGASEAGSNSLIPEQQSRVHIAPEELQALSEQPDQLSQLRVDLDAAREFARNAAREAARSTRIAMKKLNFGKASSVESSAIRSEVGAASEPLLEIDPLSSDLQAARNAARESSSRLKRVLRKL